MTGNVLLILLLPFWFPTRFVSLLNKVEMMVDFTYGDDPQRLAKLRNFELPQSTKATIHFLIQALATPTLYGLPTWSCS